MPWQITWRKVTLQELRASSTRGTSQQMEWKWCRRPPSAICAHASIFNLKLKNWPYRTYLSTCLRRMVPTGQTRHCVSFSYHRYLVKPRSSQIPRTLKSSCIKFMLHNSELEVLYRSSGFISETKIKSSIRKKENIHLPSIKICGEPVSGTSHSNWKRSTRSPNATWCTCHLLFDKHHITLNKANAIEDSMPEFLVDAWTLCGT